jgi:threonine/homoserine/homoserine lactone efflux protein
MLANWLTVLVVTSFALISPGPNFVVVVRASLTGSRWQGLAAALGASTGDAVHATY